jgi:hypothetical protein
MLNEKSKIIHDNVGLNPKHETSRQYEGFQYYREADRPTVVLLSRPIIVFDDGIHGEISVKIDREDDRVVVCLKSPSARQFVRTHDLFGIFRELRHCL